MHGVAFRGAECTSAAEAALYEAAYRSAEALRHPFSIITLSQATTLFQVSRPSQLSRDVPSARGQPWAAVPTFSWHKGRGLLSDVSLFVFAEIDDYKRGGFAVLGIF